MEFRQAMREREWQYKRLEQVLELVSYLLQCYLVKTKSVLNRVMYLRVVHFLSYFISIFREQRRERESVGGGGIVVIVVELFNFFLCK